MLTHLMITANSTKARNTLYDIFKRRREELLVSKFGSRAYLVKNSGEALELAYREKIRDDFGSDIFAVEPVRDRDLKFDSLLERMLTRAPQQHGN